MDNMGLLKQLLCKHKWVISISIIIGLAFPFALNWLVMQHTSFSVAGKPETWIAFWPSYLSAIASFGMIVLTAITLLFNNETLKNNKEQLDEMKRQWEEEHKPNVSVSFHLMGTKGHIRLVNTSVVEVKDLSIETELYYQGKKVEGATFPDLRTLKINIEPKGVRNVGINDIAFNIPNTEFLIVRLNYNGETKEPIKLSCNQVYTIGDDIIWREMIDVIKKKKS
ncbi:MAG: hypothetical protein IKR05_13085 [Prevotella sp.]|nr:hypothetical protein [Prevotella sp.]